MTRIFKCRGCSRTHDAVSVLLDPFLARLHWPSGPISGWRPCPKLVSDLMTLLIVDRRNNFLLTSLVPVSIQPINRLLEGQTVQCHE